MEATAQRDVQFVGLNEIAMSTMAALRTENEVPETN
jgi:hypothetical protein